ncbi:MULTISPECIES: dihydrofolate reductase [Bacillus]|uniref:dihydrofolate reductase n=1 Tax=Bacillus TaxID=1386 RepID=UPI000BB80C71|nr:MULTISPECIES: dihydrofolate reductase [Bacillus]
MISLIVAYGRNKVIGKDNKMPWHLPADLRYFKETTLGKTVVMGRKTFQSIGKALPRRKNVVITSQLDFEATGCELISSLDEALQLAKEQETFIIGGATIYKQAIEHADFLYVTYIDEEFEGDAFFPEWNVDEWELLSSKKGEIDEKNKYNYYFNVYKRRLYKA